MQERLKVKVQGAPCFGRDGLVGKTTPLLSAFACGLSILKTQAHLFPHGSIGRRICQIHFSCTSAKWGLRSRCGFIWASCDEFIENSGSSSIPLAFVKSLA